MKKSVLTLALAGILTIGGTVIAFADEAIETYQCRVNGTTGVQSLMNEGLSFEEAKDQMLANKFERVDNAVERGTITAERGEEIKAEMEERSESCTTPGEYQENCEGYGLNQGGGNGQGLGKGNGTGVGNSQGRGMRNGSCRVNG